MTVADVVELNYKNIHVETSDGRSFNGRLNLAGEYLVLGWQEYLIHLNEVSSLREI